MPWSTPGMPVVTAAPPAASTPTSRRRRVHEAGEGAGGVRATTHTGHHHVRVPAVQQVPALATGLVSHHPLELADHVGEGVGAHDRAEAVVAAVHRGHPVPQGLVHRVLQRAAA